MRWLVFVYSRYAKHVIMSLQDTSTCSNNFFSSRRVFSLHAEASDCFIIPCRSMRCDGMCYLIREKNHWEYHCKSKSIKHRSNYSRMNADKVLDIIKHLIASNLIWSEILWITSLKIVFGFVLRADFLAPGDMRYKSSFII